MHRHVILAQIGAAQKNGFDMTDEIVKTISSPEGNERIVIVRRADQNFSYYRQRVWNRHRAGTSEFFIGPAADGVWALPGPTNGIFASAELAEADALAGISWSAGFDAPRGPLGTGDELSISDIAELAEQILRTSAPNAYVQKQEWDHRIDCLMRLPDGGVIGERVRLTDVTETRIREAGARLQQRLQGFSVLLQDEVKPGIRLERLAAPVDRMTDEEAMLLKEVRRLLDKASKGSRQPE